MDDKIKKTIEKIKLLANQNPEFAKEMKALFGKSESSSDLPILTSVSNDVTAIRSALEIRATESLKYNFVKVARLRDQLIIDNLRMENAALNLQEKESDRFYIFCVNAFYQLENIINYYYHVMFPNVNDLLNEIEIATSRDPEEFQFKRKGNEKTVVDITVYYKITAICNSLFTDNLQLKMTLNNLRKIRNEAVDKNERLMDYNYCKLTSYLTTVDYFDLKSTGDISRLSNLVLGRDYKHIVSHVCFYNSSVALEARAFWNKEQVPAEQAAAKMQQADELLYPDKVVKDLPLYGNQWIPLGIKATIQERTKICAAFDEFCNDYEDAHLFIIGGYGILYEDIKAQVDAMKHKGSVTLIKGISNPMPILKRCDLFIFPSLYEGWGIVVIEADVLNVPVIATDIVGTQWIRDYDGHLVEDSRNGIFEGIHEFMEGKIGTLNIDYDEFNEMAVNEFYSIIDKE